MRQDKPNVKMQLRHCNQDIHLVKMLMLILILILIPLSNFAENGDESVVCGGLGDRIYTTVSDMTK